MLLIGTIGAGVLSPFVFIIVRSILRMPRGVQRTPEDAGVQPYEYPVVRDDYHQWRWR